MANSSRYWNFLREVKDATHGAYHAAKTMYDDLENDDELGDAIEYLPDISKQLKNIVQQIDAAIPLLKKADAGLAAVPEFKL